MKETDAFDSLLCVIKSGDDIAFAELVGIFTPYLQAKAHSFHISPADYDDMLQWGRLALLRAAKTYEKSLGATFTTYARKCIANAYISFMRTLKSSRNSTEHPLSIDDLQSLGDDSHAPENMYLLSEMMQRIEKGMEAVLSKTERVVLSKKLEGLSNEQIAVLLGKETKSVENTLYRARKKLKQHLYS